MRHLDDRLLASMLADPKAHRELVAHLDAGCETCDAFLEAHASGLLDGHTDAVLLSAAPAKSAPLDEVGYARVRRNLKRPSRVWAVAAIAALVLAGVVSVVLLRPPPPADGLKAAGPGRLLLELSAAVRAPDGSLTRVTDGARLSPGDAIVFRAHASEAGVATLWLEPEGGAPRRLGDVPLEAGTNDLKLHGEYAGVSLAGERGRVTVWVIASRAPTPLSPAQARSVVDSGASRDVALGRLVVVVEP